MALSLGILSAVTTGGWSLLFKLLVFASILLLTRVILSNL